MNAIELNVANSTSYQVPLKPTPLETNYSSYISDLKANQPQEIQASLPPAYTIHDFKQEEIQIKEYFEMVLSLDPNQKETDEVLNQLLPKFIEKIISENLDLSEPITPFLFKESYVKKSPKMEIAVVGANIMSRGSSVISLGMLLNKIQDVIIAKKSALEAMGDENEKSILKNEIDALMKWHTFHSESFSNLISDNITDTIFSLPKAVSAIISLTKTGSSCLGMLVGWIGMGVSLVGYAFDWGSKKNKVEKHEIWNRMFNGTEKTAEKILERQEKIYKKRLVANLPELESLLKSINDEIKTSYDEKAEVLKKMLVRLKDQGIVFTEEPATLAALQTILSSLAEKASLNEMMVKKKEMITVSIRNGIKTLNQKKSEIDKGFLRNEEDKASGFFILYTYITTWTVALETLLASNVITSVVVATFLSSILAALSYGTLVGLVVSVAIGSLYLHLKKPNTFKTYLKAVQLRLVFWNIPLGMKQFKKKCRQLEAMKVCSQINELRNRIFDADSSLRSELVDQRKVKEEELNLLFKQVLELNDSIAALEAKVKPLQEQIADAGWNDFLMHVDGNLDTTAVIRKIAEHLLKDATILKDKQNKKLFMNMGGIDLSIYAGKDMEWAAKDLSMKIQAFYSMDPEDKIKYDKNHKLLEAHGILA